MKRFLLFIGFLIITAALATGGAAVYVYVQYTSPSNLAQERDIIIPQGTGVRGIAEIFQRENIITEPLIFLAGVRVSQLDRSLRAGNTISRPGSARNRLLKFWPLGIRSNGLSPSQKVFVPAKLSIGSIWLTD